MMERLDARGAALGAVAVTRARDRVAQAMRDALPGVTVAVTDDGVAITGRALARRLIDEPALRWPAGLVR